LHLDVASVGYAQEDLAMRQPQLTGFGALRRIAYGTVGGLLIAALYTNALEPKDPGDYMFCGAIFGSLVGFVTTWRRAR